MIRHKLSHLRRAIPSLLLASCATHGVAGTAGPVPDATCFLSGGEAGGTGATVATTDPIDLRHAPVPLNRSEHQVFHQMYETLIEIDCTGRAVAGLAVQWVPADGDSSTFLVSIRNDARFADGFPVTAGVIVDDWRARRVAGGLRSDLFEIASENETTLRIRYYAHPYNIVELLSDPVRAVTRQSDTRRWPVGTTGYRVITSTPDRVVLETTDPEATTPLQYVRYGGDLRDALDDGVDLVVTDRADALDYSRQLEAYNDRQLGWGRTYFLILEGRQRSLYTEVRGDFLEAIASDAFGDAARPFAAPEWWTNGMCGSVHPLLTTPVPTTRIAYQRDDVIAKQLAERLVFLARSGQLPPELRQISENAIAVSQPNTTSSNRETATIIAVGRFHRNPCEFLIAGGSDRGRNAFALVDIRDRSIAKTGAPQLLIFGDGIPTFRRIP